MNITRIHKWERTPRMKAKTIFNFSFGAFAEFIRRLGLYV